MKSNASLRYLNSILTVITVLLALNVYLGFTSSPAGHWLAGHATQEAIASDQNAFSGAGIPNAGAQRKAMVDELKMMNAKVDRLSSDLTSGRVRVVVENLNSD